MFLATNITRTLCNKITFLPGCIHISKNKSSWSTNNFTFQKGFFRVCDSREFVNLHNNLPDSPACILRSYSNYQRHRLADITYLIAGQQFFIWNDRPYLIFTGNEVCYVGQPVALV